MALAAGQAPALEAMVASGELPPLEERLPANPLVVEGESVGKYGGTWRMGMNAGPRAGTSGPRRAAGAGEGFTWHDPFGFFEGAALPGSERPVESNGRPIRNGAISSAPSKWPRWTSCCFPAR